VRPTHLPERPIRVAVHVADRALRERLVRALAEAGDFAPARFADADVTIADRPVKSGGPVIAVVPAALVPIAEVATWRCDVRAVLPTDVEATVLGAVITVIAAGVSVTAPDVSGGADNRAGNPAGAGAWAEALDHSGAEDEELAVALTPREREVLALLAAGASNKDIARALDLSVHTAKFHVASLTEKLGARGRLEAVAIAIRTGLVMV
jgi:DNA-binding CsgD family transcriptional regulator